ALAKELEKNEEIQDVKYPFLSSHPQYELAKKQMKAGGGIITIEVKGGQERAFKFLDALRMILYTSNLGDARSIATHPSSTTHSKLTELEREALGIRPGTVRLSIGIEDEQDIIDDILQALQASK
ncbi:MAG: PLP-dependent transferase, partial [Sphingobacterium sp.]